MTVFRPLRRAVQQTPVVERVARQCFRDFARVREMVTSVVLLFRAAWAEGKDQPSYRFAPRRDDGGAEPGGVILEAIAVASCRAACRASDSSAHTGKWQWLAGSSCGSAAMTGGSHVSRPASHHPCGTQSRRPRRHL